MAEYELPTGEIVEAPDDMDPEEALAVIQQNFLSPSAIPNSLIGAMIQTESAGNAKALGPKTRTGEQAMGLMQLMPGTAKELGVNDPFNPEENVAGGTAYITKQLAKYGNLDHALAAYNWGPNNVDKWLAKGGDPANLPGETRAYIARINALMGGQSIPVARERAESSSFFQQVANGFRTGVPETISMFLGGAASLSSTLGNPEVSKELQAAADEFFSEAQLQARGISVPQYSSVKNWGDFIKYVGAGGGRLAPQILATLGPAVLASVLAAPVGLASVAGVGTMLGSAYLSGTGDVQRGLTETGVPLNAKIPVSQALKNLGIDVDPSMDLGTVTPNELATTFGVPMALIETALGPERFLMKMLGGKAAGKAVGIMLAGPPQEAAEEFAQTYVEGAAIKTAKGGDLFTKERFAEAKDAAAMGALGGLIGSAPIALMTMGADGKPQTTTSATDMFETPVDGTTVWVDLPGGGQRQAKVIGGVRIANSDETMVVLDNGLVVPPGEIHSAPIEESPITPLELTDEIPRTVPTSVPPAAQANIAPVILTPWRNLKRSSPHGAAKALQARSAPMVLEEQIFEEPDRQKAANAIQANLANIWGDMQKGDMSNFPSFVSTYRTIKDMGADVPRERFHEFVADIAMVVNTEDGDAHVQNLFSVVEKWTGTQPKFIMSPGYSKFYDPIEKALTETPQGAADSKQWMNFLTKSGADPKLVDFMLGDYLNRPGTIKKADLLNEWKAHQVQISEVRTLDDNERYALDDQWSRTNSIYEGLGKRFAYTMQQHDATPHTNLEERDKLFKLSQQIADEQTAASKKLDQIEKAMDRKVKGGFHTLGGGQLGQNYRELHITAPQFMAGSEGQAPAWKDGHTHFEYVNNPIVRIRFNEHKTLDGKRVLLIEELQPPRQQEMAKMPEFFRNNWASLGLKRALIWAAENGFDYVAWTTGEQQIKRWGLRKVASALYADKNPFSDVELWFFENAARKSYPPVPIMAAHIPEELKQQVRAQPGTGRKGIRFKEPVLLMEKKWPVDLYDKHLPNLARKLGEKYETKPTHITIGNAAEQFQVWALPIPTTMMESVRTRGLPFKQLTSAAEAQRDTIIREGKALIQRIAPTAQLRFFETDRQVGGMQLGNLIYVATNKDYLGLDTFAHEGFHHLDWIDGVFTETDRKILTAEKDRLSEIVMRAYAKHKPEVRAHIANEMRTKNYEQWAYPAGIYIAARERGEIPSAFPRAVRPIFERILRIIRRMRNKLEGLGFKTSEDIFEDVRSGAAGARAQAIVFNNARAPHVSRVAEEAAQYLGMKDKEFMDWYEGSVVVDEKGRPTPLFQPTDYSAPMAEWNGPAGPAHYFYDKPEHAGLHPYMTDRPDTVTAMNLNEVLEQYPTTDPMIEELNSRHQMGQEGKAVFPSMVAIKNPYFAADPLSPHDKKWFHSRVDLLTFIPREERLDMKDAISGAASMQDFISSTHSVLQQLPLLYARTHGFDALRFHTSDGWPAWAYVGDPSGMKSLMPAWGQGPKEIWGLGAPSNYTFQDTKDVGKALSFLLGPRDLAKVNGLAAPVYVTGESMRRDRSNIIGDAATLAARYGALTQDERFHVDQVMELERLQGLKLRPNRQGQIIVANQIRDTDMSRVGDVITLTDKEVEAHQNMQKMGELIWDALRESYMWDQPDVFEGIFPPAYQIPWNPNWTRAQITAIVAGIQQYSTPRPGQQPTTMQKQMEDEAQRLNDIALRLDEIEVTRNSYTYVPMSRFGSWGTIIEDAAGNLLHFETFNSPMLRSKSPPMQSKVNERLDELLARYPGARIRTDPVSGSDVFKLTHENIARMAGNPLLSLDMLLGQMSQNKKDIYEQLRPAIESAIKSKGFASHLKQAAMIPGYSTDFRRAWGTYIVGAAGFAARQKWGRTLNRAVAAVPASMTNVFNYVHAYRDYIMSSKEEFSFWRGLMFTWYLGGNISSALIQLGNLPIYSAPQLGKITSMTRAHAEVARATKDAGKLLASMAKMAMTRKLAPGATLYDPSLGIYAHLPQDEQDAITHAYREGLLKPALMIQQVGLTPMLESNIPFAIVNPWQQAQTKLAHLFGAMESTARVAHFLAAYRVAKDPAALQRAHDLYRDQPLWMVETNGVPTPYDYARYEIDNVMGQFDKTNRPPYERGIGTIALQFQSWTRQILSTLAFSLVKEGVAGKKAFLFSMLWLLAFAGLWGLPGGDDIKDTAEWAWKHAGGRDLNLEQAMRDFFVLEADLEPVFADALLRGGLRYLGVDGRRLGIGKLPGSNIVGSVLGDNESYELLGPTGSTAIGAARNMAARRSSGEPLFIEAPSGSKMPEGMPIPSAIKEVLPQFIKNFIDGAMLWNVQGYQTRNQGKVLITDTSTAEEIIKAIGFLPARVARIQEERLAVLRENKDQGPEGVFRGRYIREGTKMAAAFYKGDIKELAKAREAFDQIDKEVNKYNEGRPANERVSINKQNILTQVYMNLDPSMRSMADASPQKRERVKEIERTFPK